MLDDIGCEALNTTRTLTPVPAILITGRKDTMPSGDASFLAGFDHVLLMFVVLHKLDINIPQGKILDQTTLEAQQGRPGNMSRMFEIPHSSRAPQRQTHNISAILVPLGVDRPVMTLALLLLLGLWNHGRNFLNLPKLAELRLLVRAVQSAIRPRTIVRGVSNHPRQYPAKPCRLSDRRPRLIPPYPI